MSLLMQFIVSSVIAINTAIVYGQIFFGVGHIMFSDRWKYIDQGTQIAYRPENYAKCKYTEMDLHDAYLMTTWS